MTNVLITVSILTTLVILGFQVYLYLKYRPKPTPPQDTSREILVIQDQTQVEDFLELFQQNTEEAIKQFRVLRYPVTSQNAIIFTPDEEVFASLQDWIKTNDKYFVTTPPIRKYP